MFGDWSLLYPRAPTGATAPVDGGRRRADSGMMVPLALIRAFPDIFLPAARAVLIRSLLLTIGLFSLLGFGLWWVIRALVEWMGWGEQAGLAGAAAAALIALFAFWLLFRAVAMAILGFFADEIVVAVEGRSYPAAAASARPVGAGQGMRFAVRSVLRMIGWNIIALPLYIALLATGVGAAALFLALNAYLLGRDLADLVEPRHPDLPPIGGAMRWLMGLAGTLLFLIPVANLFAPVWSAAMAVHMLHANRKSRL